MHLLLTFLFLILFLIIFFLFYYPAGLFTVKKLHLEIDQEEDFLFSILFSIIFFVFLAIFLGITRTRYLMLPLVIFINLLSINKLKKELVYPLKALVKNKVLILLLIIGIVIQGIINFPSGYSFGDGLRFWSSQGNDGLWHVSLMEEIKKSLPIINPIYSGIKLNNYHYLVDILMGEFGKMFPFFSSLDLYFRFFPIVFSFLIGLSSFLFVKRWTNNKYAGYWAIFFTSLSGGFGYIVTFIKDRNFFSGETTFWAAQGNTIIGNPPHAISYALITACFLAILIYYQKRNKNALWLSVLGLFLIGFKVSAGIVFLVGLWALALFDLLVNKKTRIIVVSAILTVTNYVSIKLMSRDTASFLIWQPWWFIRTTIVDSARVGWMDLEFRRQHYLSVGRFTSYLRIIELETIAFLLFFIGNLGARIIGAVGFVRKKINPIDILLFTSMLIAFAIPLFFVQKGIAYNLIQFMQYFILIFGFFAAATVANLFFKIRNRLFRIVLMILFIFLSTPTVVGNIKEFYGKGRSAIALISYSEMDALKYLKKNTKQDSIILTEVFDEGQKYDYKKLPLPIYAWYSTAYVSAISSRRTFLSNEGQVDIIGLPVGERRDEVKKFFIMKDLNWGLQFLKDNNIDYIYIVKPGVKKYPDLKEYNLKKYFENSEVLILQV